MSDLTNGWYRVDTAPSLEWLYILEEGELNHGNGDIAGAFPPFVAYRRGKAERWIVRAQNGALVFLDEAIQKRIKYWRRIHAAPNNEMYNKPK